MWDFYSLLIVRIVEWRIKRKNILRKVFVNILPKYTIFEENYMFSKQSSDVLHKEYKTYLNCVF